LASLACATAALGLAVGCDSQPFASPPPKPAPVLASTKPAKPTPVSTPAPRKPAAPTATAVASAPAPTLALAAEKFTAHTARQLIYDEQEGSGGDGEKTRTTIVLADALPDCHCAGKSWWVRYYDNETASTPRREVHLTIDASGYIAVTEEIDRADKVEVVYTPALVLVPDKLPAKSSGNAGYTQEVKMVVHPLGDRSKIKTHGTATNEIVFEGDEPLITGVGAYTAHRITATVTARLSAATTTDITEQWLIDDIGIAAERNHEETRVLGAKVRDNTSTLLLRAFSTK
jgi:hypothetical protein